MDNSGKNKDNVFFILELSLSESSVSDRKIEEVMKAKRREWARLLQQHDEKKNIQVYEYTENIDQMKEILSDTKKIKKAKIKADQYMNEVLEREARKYAGLKIPEMQMKRWEYQTGIPREMLKKEMKSRYGIVIVQDETTENLKDFKDRINPPVILDIKPEEAHSLGFENLYQYLCRSGEVEREIRRSNNAELLERLNKLEKEIELERNSPKQAIRKNLCKKGKQIFYANALRKTYDEYLVWEKTDMLIDSILRIAWVNEKQIRMTLQSEYRRQLKKIYEETPQKAEDLLRKILDYLQPQKKSSAKPKPINPDNGGTSGQSSQAGASSKYGEIENEKIENGDGYVKVSWKTVWNGARVVVHRRNGAAPPVSYMDGENIPCTASGLLDTNVKNGEEYGYLIWIKYPGGHWTKGKTFIGKPQRKSKTQNTEFPTPDGKEEQRTKNAESKTTNTEEKKEKINVKTVWYSIKVTGRIHKNLEITFEQEYAGKTKFELPAVEIYCCMGAEPMCKSTDNEKVRLFYRIDSQTIWGSKTIKIPMTSVKKNTFIKLFFKDNAVNKTMVLKLKEGKTRIS